MLIEVADEMLVLGIRPRGNLHRLLVERLGSGRRGVLLVDLPGLQPDAVKCELVSRGAVSWTPQHELLLPFENVTDECDRQTMLKCDRLDWRFGHLVATTPRFVRL